MLGRHGKYLTVFADLLHSLDFVERSQRYERITEAHQNTFDWIFEKPELGLVSWLRKGTGIYWIQGKPGSGKSTLMKFLHDHHQTSEILNQWRQGVHHTSAWFFFNERGSYIEKSFEGLLLSIIREIISTNERLAELVLEVYLERVKHSSNQSQTWHSQDLECALSAIVSQREQNLELLLFLDALDEYSGPPEMMVDFVQSLVQPVPDARTEVKVLISSRPWDAFVANFDQQPGFKMHEQTKSDMRIFVLDKLGTTQTMAPTSSPAESLSNRAARDIVSTVVYRAEGVFLWVKLVIDSLLAAGPNATMLQLENLLQALPDGLEELYERTIDRISRSSRLEAFIAIEIVNRASSIMTLHALTLVASCALGKTFEECVELVKKRKSSIDDEKDALQLKNLCGGLIEMNRERDGVILVQFMHQTVKDFVSRPGFEHRILGHSYAPLYENGFSFQMKYILAMNGLALRYKPELEYQAHREDPAYFARRAEETTGNSQKIFLNSISDQHFPWENLCTQTVKRRPTSILSFAVLGNLLLYTAHKLHTTNVVSSNSQIPLLQLAVERAFNWDLVSYASMIQLLIDKGADINEKFEGETPFQFNFTRFRKSGEYSTFLNDTTKVVEVFLKHKQDVDVDIPTDYGVCKGLHIARCEVSEALLRGGAQVNALDSRGFTALDHVMNGSISSRAHGMDVPTASILLHYGGCITHSTRKHIPEFLERVSVYDPNLVLDSYRNPPQLPMTLVQRFRRIVSS